MILKRHNQSVYSKPQKIVTRLHITTLVSLAPVGKVLQVVGVEMYSNKLRFSRFAKIKSGLKDLLQLFEIEKLM